MTTWRTSWWLWAALACLEFTAYLVVSAQSAIPIYARF